METPEPGPFFRSLSTVGGGVFLFSLFGSHFYHFANSRPAPKLAYPLIKWQASGERQTHRDRPN